MSQPPATDDKVATEASPPADTPATTTAAPPQGNTEPNDNTTPRKVPRPPQSRERPNSTRSGRPQTRNDELESTSKKNFGEVKGKLEALIKGQQDAMSSHLQRAASARESNRQHFQMVGKKWKERARECRRATHRTALEKLEALEKKEEEQNEYLASAQLLTDEYVSNKVTRSAQRRHRLIQLQKTRDEEGELVLADYCDHHHIYCPPKPDNDFYFETKRTALSARRAGPAPSSHLMRPLLKSEGDKLPELLMSREEARQHQLAKKEEERTAMSLRRQERGAEKQQQVEQRVQELLDHTIKRYVNDLKKKEQARERVARMLEVKRNPRRAMAVNRLAKSHPELWD